MGEKYEMSVLDKDGVVAMVNRVGAEVGKENRDISMIKRLTEEVVPYGKEIDEHTDSLLAKLSNDAAWAERAHLRSLNLDTPEGRKDFLQNNVGINASTPDDFRLVMYRDESGHRFMFKGHAEGDKKLVLTESTAFADNAYSEPTLMFHPAFKPMPKAIEISVTSATPQGDGALKVEISDTERKKLDTQAAFASMIQKSGDVQLASNARLPNANPSKTTTASIS